MTVATIVLAGGRANVLAHPEPAPDRNNRYLKLTPMADRLRLAYTVYLGEQPGALARRRLDRDRDGTIDDREAAAIGDELAALIEPAVVLTIDDRPVAIDWASIDVGLGTPRTAAGSFSVDLIGWACLGDGARHRLHLRDRVRLDRPGEVEVKLEVGPGITIEQRRLGGGPMPELIATATGDDGKLADGLELTFTVDDDLAVRPDDRRCGPRAEPRGPRWPLLLGGAGLALAAIGALVVRASRRRGQGRSGGGDQNLNG